jgi:aspartate-semialdehyde dehydrogenase
MVGSVLMQRMIAENDFALVEPVCFSTSNVGGSGPTLGPRTTGPLLSAMDIEALAKMDIIITCQGGDYTNQIFPPLRSRGWNGYWIDAASSLRMKEDAIIILDPVNEQVIRRGLATGVKNFIGGNCTVSLMLMALHGLFQQGLIEWLTSRFGRWRTEHAGVTQADGFDSRQGGAVARGPSIGHPGNRSDRRRQPAGAGFSYRKFRRAAGR